MPNTERIFSEQQEASFADWISKYGIKAALFDLDGTLIDTSDFIYEQYKKFFAFCKTQSPDLDIEKFKEDFTALDHACFESMGVSFSRWNFIVSSLGQNYNTNLFEKGIVFFNEIYLNSPEIFEGAKETLELCKKAGLKVGLVTHATTSWTNIKLEKLGLQNHFDHIKVVDIEEHRYKGPQHWQEAINSMGVHPQETLVVGDNLKGDIIASHQIGVKKLAWITSKWHVYNQGEKPFGIYQIEEIGKLIGALCQKD